VAAGESVFVGHDRQTLSETAFSSTEYVLLGHSMHNELPLIILKVPAIHGVHAIPSAPVVPGIHVQPDRNEVPGSECVLFGHVKHVSGVFALLVCEYLPDTHMIHSESPMVSLYFPVAHVAHGPPFSPVVPVLHMQDVLCELLGYDDESAGQLVHTSIDVAADVPEYVSFGQLIHSELPITSLYFPGLH